MAEPVSSDVDDDSRPKSFDFFLSYASSDSDIAREVFDVVKGAGYSITAQFQDFGAGANFVREMQHALATSAKLIAIYSPAYERSDHCQAEWSAAYNEDPGGLKRKIVAFMFQPTALNLLARQIVYTSLIGFNKTRRANAVLQAIGYKIPLRSKREIAREVARVASPDVEFRAGRLNAIPNRKLDISNRDTGVAELSLTLSQIAGIIIESLPGNTPPIVSKCLIVYKKNLDEYENGPILGVLNVAAAAVEREYRGQDSALWGPGLDGLISELFRIHGLFVANFPKDSERERLFSEISVDDSLIANGTIEENVAKASDALAKIANEGLTTPTFDRIVKDLKDQAEQIYFDPQIVQNKGFFGVSARQRLVLGTIGFYERILSALGNVAKIADSPTMVHAISVVRQAVENLLKLLS
nr:toll/interleukin-1 receptor domain-containing protein [Polymorphobacter megasporae]